MKKWALGFIIGIVALLAAFYFFTPAYETVSSNLFVSANKNAVYRSLTEQQLLQKWWPVKGETVKAEKKGLVVSGSGYTFIVSPGAFDVVSIRMNEGAAPVQSFLTIFPVTPDSAAISWKAELQGNKGPLARLQNYFLARKLKREMAGVMKRLQVFLQSDKNIYGLTITPQKVTDTLLAVTRLNGTGMPTVETYYELIKKLRAHIARAGAQESNYPMLNIFALDSNQYETMVAIPVNKRLANDGPVLFKHMIPGAILVTEVRGGPGTIKEAFRQLEFFMTEHGWRQPGMPFQSLVTDRMAEPDTAKWITKLYYPVL